MEEEMDTFLCHQWENDHMNDIHDCLHRMRVYKSYIPQHDICHSMETPTNFNWTLLHLCCEKTVMEMHLWPNKVATYPGSRPAFAL